MYARRRLSVLTERHNWALLPFVSLWVIFATSCGHSGEEASGLVKRIPLHVTPYYNSAGPQIDVGKYSEALAGANGNTIEKTIGAMKSDWDKLRPEAMYVAAICLFDLGLKDEAVYWFYSAQYRARLFQSRCGVAQSGPIGDEAFELSHAYNAFFQLLGRHINPHAMDNPKKLAETIARVLAEGKAIHDCRSLYPGIVFDDNRKWSEVQEEVSNGLSELLKMLEEHAAAYPDGMPEDTAGDALGRADTRRIWPAPQVAALATAAQDGRVVEIDRLVAAGVDVNTKGLGSTTPLYWALRHFSKPGYKRLLEHGASPNVETADGDSVMHFAAGWIDPEWLELALKYGGDPNLPRSRHRRFPNRTPIFDAIGGGNVKHQRLLIDAGANVNQEDHQGKSALEYAIRLGKYESAHQLLEAGADYSIKSSQGKDIAALIRERVGRTGQETVWPGKVLDFIQRPYADNTPRGPDEAGDMRQ